MKTTLMTVLAVAALSSILTSCGSDDTKKTDNDATGDGDVGPAAALYAADETLAGENVTAQIDEGIASSVDEDEADAGASLGLAPRRANLAREAEVIRFRECKEDSGKALVHVLRSLEISKTFEGPVRKSSLTVKGWRDVQRTWSRASGAVECAENNKHAALEKDAMEGVTLDSTFDRGRSMEGTVENKKKKTTVAASRKIQAKGTRHIEWTNVETNGDTLILEKTVATTAERTFEAANKKGQKKSFTQSVTTATPLSMKVERDAASLALKSREIIAGKLVATGKDGDRTETTFANVKYVAGQGCMAVSGKITGAIYAKDATEPKVTYEINFDGDTKSVVFSNGKEFDYSPDGCDLDEPAPGAEKEKAADITHPEGV